MQMQCSAHQQLRWLWPLLQDHCAAVVASLQAFYKEAHTGIIVSSRAGKQR